MCKKIRRIEINKQDFLSGRIINLIKETQKNIRLAMREKNMGENQNKTHASSNTFKAVSIGFVSRINK